ncbi:MAG: hypothetical protein AB7L66_07180 [Gemmatimonadales bacterium]
MFRPTFAGLAALLAVCPLQAQTSVSLTKPAAELDEPFTSIAAVRELPSGKVLVADRQDKVVQLIDFASGSVTKVGREGQGPGEYALPVGLLAMPNGVTWINDIGGRRFLEVDPTGKPGKTIQPPGAGNGGMMMISIGGGGTDSKGHYYYQAPPFNPSNLGGDSPDSLAIQRWDGAEKVDTVAWMVGPKANVSTSGGGNRTSVSIRLGSGKVFSPAEAWGVADDGSVVRVQPNPYRVLRYPAGSTKPAVGPTQAYTPIKVTQADKDEVIEARKRSRPMFITSGNGGTRTTAGNNIQIPDPEFEETKPPFSGGAGGGAPVLVAPEGEVWVLRNQAAGAKNPVYDVFDRAGTIAKKVTLRPRSRVVGFGKGTVYVVRLDEDDLQYLERYTR